MTKDEALKLALEALEYRGVGSWRKKQPAITAIKEALAQPEQEPDKNIESLLETYWHLAFDEGKTGKSHGDVANEVLFALCYLYTTQSQRTWVGLTKKEFQEAVEGLEDLENCWVAIEAKLKEKNVPKT